MTNTGEIKERVMSKEYPLYPELTEQGKEEAQKIMDSFKPKLLAIMQDVMDDLYADVSYYIESDHWTNYRNALMDGFMGYGGKQNHAYDYKQLRQAIYRNHKDEIVNDLNQDHGILMQCLEIHTHQLVCHV